MMQPTHGVDIDSPYSGGEDVDRIVISVRNGPSDPIHVYEVPGQVFRDRMKKEYEDCCKIPRLNPTDFRVLRFDERGYPFQRVYDEWKEYEVYYDVTPDKQATKKKDKEPKDSQKIVEEAKVLIAEAYGVSPDKASILVSP